MLLNRRLFFGGGARQLQTSLVTNRASAAGSNSFVYGGISLGDGHPNRTFFLMYSARTNSTTGPRRLNSATLTVGGVTNAFTYLHDSGVVQNPRGIMVLELPEGATGTLSLAISGNSTGWVSGLVTIWAARGRFQRIDSGIVGAGVGLNLTTEQNGVFLHQAASFTEAPLGVPTNRPVNDGSWTLNGLTVRSGRNTSTPAGSLTITTSNANTSLGVALAQR